MASSPAALQKPFITFRGSSPTVFGRMYCTHQQAPQPEEKEKEMEAMQPEEEEDDMKQAEVISFTELYNTSQKILIGCLGDFTVAHSIASALGDASNVVVITQNTCGEMKVIYENAESHIFDLTKLGARIVFNVDFKDVANDSRINQTVYDINVLVVD